jgi:hypothetical protein
MRYKNLILGALMLLGFELTGLQAQESVNASGSNAIGSGGSASYSVGQVVCATNTETSGSVIQGAQQPFEISIVNSIEEAIGITLSVSAYPNPTTDYVTLEIKELDISDLHFQLYDINGKLLQGEKITDNQTIIVMSNLVASTYFVKVNQSNKEIRIFKINKK